MALFSEILVPVDGSRGAIRALPVAAAIARGAGLPVTLFEAVSTPAAVDDTRARLQTEAAAVPGATAEVVVAPVGRAALVDRILANPSVLVVMPTHARAAVTEILLGSVADEVVRSIPGPVVLVGPACEAPADDTTYGDLVACVDSGDTAARLDALVAAAQDELGLHPTLFEVAGPPGHSPDEDGHLGTAALRTVVDGLVERKVQIGVEVVHEADVPAAVVAAAHRRSRPIVALVTHGRHPLARMRAGSVAMTVLRTVTCPVLVYGPAAASSTPSDR